LLGIDSMKSLYSHPKVGASWEGIVIEQMLMIEPHDEVFFWATHQGAEIDLILRRGDALYGVECKRADTPRLTPSIRIALDDLKLKHVFVIYPGIQRFPLASQVEAVPFQALSKGVSLLDGF
jgi:predicted AAA+ superfamily ATPase